MSVPSGASMTLVLLLSAVLGFMPDSSACRMLGRWPFGSGWMPRDVVNDTIVYVTCGGGMYILNTKDPANILKVGELQTPGVPFFFSIRHTLLCMGEFKAGVALYDLADLSRPVQLGRCAVPYKALGTAFDGRYAYVACADSGVRVIDFLDPANPSEVASLAVPGGALSLEASDRYLFVAAEEGGVRVADISDPLSPVEVGSYEMAGDFVYDIRVRDTMLYAAFSDCGLVALNVSDPANPVRVSVLGSGWMTTAMALSGHFAYLTTQTPHAIRIIDISDPAQPRLAGTYRPPSNMGFNCLAASGNRCFTLLEPDEPSGASLRVIDVTDSANPTLAGSFHLPLSTEEIVTADTLAFAGVKGAGVQVFNIADPSHISLLGQTGDTSRIDGLCVLLPYVYAAAYHGGTFLRVIDVSDPRRPTVVGSIDTFGYAHSVAVESGFAYVSESEFLRVIDVTTPTHPVQVARLKLPSGAFGLDISGDYCYVADWYGGVQVVDISAPSNPRIVGSCPTPCAAAVDIVVRGQYAYYSDCGGFGVLDVSNPLQPTPIAYEPLPPPVQSWGIDARFTMVFVALGDSGIGVYDATDPAHPALTGYYRTPYWAYHVSVRDEIAYVADLDGFCIIQYFGQGLEESGGSSPASSHVRVLGTVMAGDLLLELNPSGGQSEVTVLDVTGRTKLTANFTAQEAGQGRVRLDVSQLPAGVYFVEARTQSERRLVKVLLAR